MPSPTAIAAGALGILVAMLGSRVSLLRLARRSDDERFKVAQRVHGNAAEHVPLLLLLLFLAETVGAPRSVLLGAALTMIVARLIHALGYSKRRGHQLQFAGATLTYLLESGLAALILVYGL